MIAGARSALVLQVRAIKQPTHLGLAGERFVDLRKAVGQDGEVLLDLGLFFLLLEDVLVDLFSLLAVWLRGGKGIGGGG